MHIADRVVLMRDGKLMRVGDSREIYEEPRTRYVAGMLGSVNEFRGRVVDVRPSGAVVESSLGLVLARPAPGAVPEKGRAAWIGLRPETITIDAGAQGGAAAENRWPGTVIRSTFLGTHMDHLVQVGDVIVEIWSRGVHAYPEGAAVSLSCESALLFDDEGGE